MLERIGAVLIITGTVLVMTSLSWLVLSLISVKFRKKPWSRIKPPLWLFLAAVVMMATPIIVNSVLTRFASLGPFNTIVDGERHLTLTGWDQTDYSVVSPFTDTIVLQMANTDVTDDTLKFLSGMTRLRELDLNNSQITDVGLSAIAKLQSLQELRLARTKITDEGFREHLLKKENLVKLDLIETNVSSKTVREWKAGKPDRKALK